MKAPQQSLKSWGDQKWRTSDGKPSKGKKRYLPDAAWKSLSASEKASTRPACLLRQCPGYQRLPCLKSCLGYRPHTPYHSSL